MQADLKLFFHFYKREKSKAEQQKSESHLGRIANFVTFEY